MLEIKLEILKDEKGIEKGFQIRKKPEEKKSTFGNGNIGNDGFYKYGSKYYSNRSLFNYFINKPDESIIYVCEGVFEKISKDNHISQIMKDHLLNMLKNYETDKIQEKYSYSTA